MNLVVTVARKPMGSSVAQNVLVYGVGGLNIDASRIGYLSELDKTPEVGPKGEAGRNNPGCGSALPTRKENWGEWKVNHSGRWPANLILEHREGCQCKGVTRVPGNSIKYTSEGKGGTRHGSFGVMGPRPGLKNLGYADEEGLETVASWQCVPGCPLAELDRQSFAGGMHSAGNKQNPKHNVEHGLWIDGGWKPLDKNPDMYGDTGGASRFFKQVISE